MFTEFRSHKSRIFLMNCVLYRLIFQGRGFSRLHPSIWHHTWFFAKYHRTKAIPLMSCLKARGQWLPKKWAFFWGIMLRKVFFKDRWVNRNQHYSKTFRLFKGRDSSCNTPSIWPWQWMSEEKKIHHHWELSSRRQQRNPHSSPRRPLPLNWSTTRTLSLGKGISIATRSFHTPHKCRKWYHRCWLLVSARAEKQGQFHFWKESVQKSGISWNWSWCGDSSGARLCIFWELIHQYHIWYW